MRESVVLRENEKRCGRVGIGHPRSRLEFYYEACIMVASSSPGLIQLVFLWRGLKAWLANGENIDDLELRSGKNAGIHQYSDAARIVTSK